MTPGAMHGAADSARESEGRRRTMLRSAMGPAIARALADPRVIEVMVNPDGALRVDILGEGRVDTGDRLEAAQVERIVRLVASHARTEVHAASPIVSAELPPHGEGAGERFEGLLPPVSLAPCFAIRKPAAKVFTLLDYVEAGKGNLLEVEKLMKQGDSVGFDAAALEARLGTLFPQELRLGDRAEQVADAKARLDAAMASFRQSMAVQSQIVANVGEDAQVLAGLAARSNGAEGSLQVAQATNQLLALAGKQQLQLQFMMATEYRAASLDRARAAQSAVEARARTKRFLGDGKAYTPQPR